MRLLRLFRRHPSNPVVAAAGPFGGLDLSALLAELEVAVPAPERIVRWDTAARSCPDCTGSVVRSAGACGRCGCVLA